MSKQYLIDEDTLRELLRDSHKLAILERDGVDNWSWYMEGREEYLTDCLGELPWNQGKTCEELNEIVEEEGYYIDNLVDDQIAAFWEEDAVKEGEWIVTPMDNFKCSICHDIYHNTYAYCPSCGAKMHKGE